MPFKTQKNKCLKKFQKLNAIAILMFGNPLEKKINYLLRMLQSDFQTPYFLQVQFSAGCVTDQF